MKLAPLKIAVVAAVAAALVAGSSAAFGALRGGSASARTVKTGVVVVNTRLATGGAAAGTGIVVASDEVLTNNHVIRGASAVRVTDPSSGRTFAATVAGYSVTRDIALLDLRNASGLRTAVIGSSGSVAVGDHLTAVGNAGGTGTLTVKRGAVIALRRSITVSDDEGGTSRLAGLIETSAPLRPGDSGGPLIRAGRVIGIDAAASTGFSFQGGEGYAIPIDTAVAIARQVDAGKKSSTVHVGATAFLGVRLGSSDFAQQPGAVVEGVAPGSPAERVGLASGEVITRFGGHRVTSATSLRNLVLRYSPGNAVKLAWVDQYTGSDSAIVRLASGPPQ
ncbi:MAG TPA: trypsin-like peptidase domain-containing protein [Gaiellaceae bacterium]|nr:trypsin-like peptidase domain-containing protein [Gaiellaceae bacterium]